MGLPMVDIPLWEIREREAEAQALLDDRLAGGKQSAAEVVAKAHAVPEKARQYVLRPGQTEAYSSGLIRSTAHPQKVWVIRITGTDLDAIPRYHFSAKTDKIVEAV
jgi:hypothetical protein